MTDSGIPPVDPFDQEIASSQTEKMRSSNAPRWQRLRERLLSAGIAPGDAAVGTLFPDDTNLEFGIVIARNGRSFAFTFDFLRDREGKSVPSREEAWIASWEELDDAELRTTYARAIEAGYELLNRENL